MYCYEAKKIIHEALNLFHFYDDHILFHIYTQIIQNTKNARRLHNGRKANTTELKTTS